MIKRYKLDGSYAVAYVSVQKNEFNQEHHFEVREKKIHNSFGLILEGSVVFDDLIGKINAQAGDIVFIPEGIRYQSHWTGNPTVSFLSVQFYLNDTVSSVWRNVALQKITGDERTLGQIRTIIERLNDFDDNDNLTDFDRYSDVYKLCSLAYPCLTKADNSLLPPALVKAVRYIQNHYVECESVGNIMEASFVSESRLYHLFSEYLHTTPVTFLNKVRIQRAMELIRISDLSLQQIATEVGFHSEFYFRQTFLKMVGVLPSQFRKML